MATKIEKQQEFIALARANYGDSVKETITRAQVSALVNDHSHITWPSWLTADKSLRAGRALFYLRLPDGKSAPAPRSSKHAATASETDAAAVLAPTFESSSSSEEPEVNVSTIGYIAGTEAEEDLKQKRDRSFVPFGHYNDLKTVMKSGRFFPVMISGMSGNGKTFQALQVCAELGLECIRANITEETSEDDLLGGYRLINGETIWHNGPATIAMERGAVLLLDEFDRGGDRMMALQPVLEGKPVYLKKVGRYVTPQPGFMVIATANTKGRGDDSGRFVSANVQDDSTLERFPLWFNQEEPDVRVKRQILRRFVNVTIGNMSDDVADFIEKLAVWADAIYRTYLDGGMQDMITTRRLVRILEAYFIFHDRIKAVQMLISRFDDQTVEAFMLLYRTVENPEEEENDPDDAGTTPDPSVSF